MIELKDVDFAYSKNTYRVISNMNLSMQKGHIYGLLGKNGVGKTTLLKLLSGLLYADIGTINVMKDDASKRQPSMLQKLFLVPDDIKLLRVTPYQYAKLYGKYYPNFKDEDFIAFLRDFEVNPRMKLNTMSFGQRKKMYLSFAFACNTDILMMDEPTNGLDIPSKHVFRKILSAFDLTDKLIIISTHMVKDISQLIDAILILDNDSMLMNATANEISKKLLFKEIIPGDRPIYSEKTIHGEWGIVENYTNEESAIDIEMLFNAVLLNKELITKIFNSK